MSFIPPVQVLQVASDSGLFSDLIVSRGVSITHSVTLNNTSSIVSSQYPSVGAFAPGLQRVRIRLVNATSTGAFSVYISAAVTNNATETVNSLGISAAPAVGTAVTTSGPTGEISGVTLPLLVATVLTSGTSGPSPVYTFLVLPNVTAARPYLHVVTWVYSAASTNLSAEVSVTHV